MHATLFALKRAYQAARHVLELQLQGSGLTVAQLDVIKLLLPSSAGLDQRALQASLGITSATLTRLLAGMERQKLVLRRPHATDARSKIVRVTAKTRRLFDACTTDGEQDYTERLLRGFSEKETVLLTQLLARIGDNMTDSES